MAHTLDTSIRYPDDATGVNSETTVNATISLAAGATAVAVGLIVGGSTARAGAAPTFAGITMQQANTVQKAATSPEASVEMWYLVDPPTGASKAIAIPNTNQYNIKVMAASFIAGGSGANTSRYDNAVGANATSTNPTVTVPASAGTAVIGIFCDGLANCVTGTSNDSGTNLYKFDLGSFGGMSQYILNANAGNVTLSYTANSDDWGAVAVSFKEDVRDRANVTQTLDATTISATGTVANAAVNFTLSASGNIPANANTATTAQLTAPANKTANDFGAGLISDDTNPLPAVNTTANQYTELEWCIAAGANVTTNHVFTWRVTVNGTVVNTYAANATWTIGTTVSNANVTQTLGATTITANAAVGVNATVSQTLAATDSTSTATVAVAAGVQQTLADASLSAAATVSIAGTVEQTLADTTIEATGTVEAAAGPTATVSQALEDVTAASTATVAVDATVEQTLDDAVCAATGTVAVAASLEQTLNDTALSSTGTVSDPAVTGTVSKTLDDTAITATATVSVSGTVSQTLAATALTATATAPWTTHLLDTSARFPATANSSTTANPISFSYTAGSTATAIAVGIIYAGITNRAGGTPTIGGVNMTQAATRRGTTEASAEVWYLCASNVGTATISIPNTGGLASKVYVASFIAPTGYISQYDTANGANATTTNPTSSVTTTANNAALFAVAASGLNDFPTSANNQTGTMLYEDDLGAWGGGAQYLLQANAGAQAMGWTAANDDWGTVSLAFRPDAARTATVNQSLDPVTISASAAATTFALKASTSISANAVTATTAQLTPPANKTAIADFQAGLISDDTNPLPSIDLITNRYTELEWSIISSAAVANAQVYSFRVTSNGTAVNTYSVTPTWSTYDVVSANVTQTMGDVTCAANAVLATPGQANATVNQTLQSVTQDIAAVTGRSATVDSTLGNISETKLKSDTRGLSGGTPTGYNFYFGRTSGTTDTIVPVAYEANLEILVASIAPALGEWYVRVRAYNASGESDFSNEVFVVVPAIRATVTNPVGNSTVIQTLADTVAASAAKVAVKTTVSQALAATTPTITGTVAISATVSQTLAAVSRSITGTVAVSASVEQTLANTGCAATVGVYTPSVEGTVVQDLADTSLVANGVVSDVQPILAWVDQVLDSALVASDAGVLVGGSLDQELASVSSTISAHAGTVIRMNINTLLDGSEVDVR